MNLSAASPVPAAWFKPAAIEPAHFPLRLRLMLAQRQRSASGSPFARSHVEPGLTTRFRAPELQQQGLERFDDRLEFRF